MLGKRGEEGIENHPSMLLGLGPTEEARLSPALYPLLPESRTLGSATPARCLALSSWGGLGLEGGDRQTGRGWEKDGTAEQKGEKGLEYYSKHGLWTGSIGITWELAGTSDSQPPP